MIAPRTLGLLAALALAGTAVPTVAAAAARRAVSGRCSTPPANRLAPYLLSPCDGARVKARADVTFTVFDRDPTAARYPPYLSLATSRTVRNGLLVPTTNGDGILHALAPVPGQPHTFAYTASAQSYPTWWDNTAGTYYVQVEQVDYRPRNGTFASPITTVRVP